MYYLTVGSRTGLVKCSRFLLPLKGNFMMWKFHIHLLRVTTHAVHYSQDVFENTTVWWPQHQSVSPHCKGEQETTFARAINMLQLKEAHVPATPSIAHPIIVLACMTKPINNFPLEENSSMVVHCNKTFTQKQVWIQGIGRSWCFSRNIAQGKLFILFHQDCLVTYMGSHKTFVL